MGEIEHSMKDRALIYLSLVVGTAALAYAAWIHRHADEMVTQALRRREAELVTHLAPKVRTVYSDLLGKTNVLAAEPRTLEELFQPMLTMVEQLGELPHDDQKTEAPK